jgi:ketosteroid isomerase-like protein
MSQRSVEIVRRAVQEFGRETFARGFAWDVRTYRNYPWAASEYRGWSGFLEFCEDWVSPYEEWEHEIEKLLSAPEGRVVAVAHQRGRLRDTHEWVDERYGLVYTVEGGLIRRVEMYRTPEEALEAARLSE